MTGIRLIADDLTGALDGAAQFTGLAAAIAVPVSQAVPMTDAWAIDSATREGDAATAHGRVLTLAPHLRPAPGGIAFLKLDSLLRGHAGAEIAACATALPATPIVIAPAFPFQGRITRQGRQWLRDGDAPIGEDLATTLRARGHTIALRRPGEPIPPGISLWDAETEDDLNRIAAAGLAHTTTPLWCGTAGLAGALAHVLDAPPRGAPALPPPLLGLIGSDHPVARAQLAAAGALAIPDAAQPHLSAIEARLAAGAAILGFALPEGLARADAASRIAGLLRALATTLPRPGSLVVGGGATFQALCHALGASRLDVVGQIEPGIPASIMRGGAWNGMPVISRSGAFGPPDLLARLAAPFLSTPPTAASSLAKGSRA